MDVFSILSFRRGSCIVGLLTRAARGSVTKRYVGSGVGQFGFLTALWAGSALRLASGATAGFQPAAGLQPALQEQTDQLSAGAESTILKYGYARSDFSAGFPAHLSDRGARRGRLYLRRNGEEVPGCLRRRCCGVDRAWRARSYRCDGRSGCRISLCTFVTISDARGDRVIGDFGGKISGR